ncbi:MAG: TolC family protein [Flavobacteriaceae bacterium]|nr:TolC family protein [Flavobacteriaceae bacterium]
MKILKYLLFVNLFIVTNSFSQTKKWSLQECVDYALENNLTIKQAKLSFLESEIDESSAKGRFLPNLNGSMGHTYNFGSGISNTDNSRISVNTQSNSFGLSTDMTIYNGRKNLNELELSRIGKRSSIENLKKVQEDMGLQIATYYLNILLAKENLKIADVRIQLSKKQLEKTEKEVELGSKPVSDMYDLRATLAQDEQNKVSSENNLSLSLLDLAQILQLEVKDFDVKNIDITEEISSNLYSTKDVYNKSLINNPYVVLADLEVEKSNISIEIEKSNYLPSLSFRGGISTRYQHTLGEKDAMIVADPNSPDPKNPLPMNVANGFWTQMDNQLGYYVGVNLSIPIFNRFQTRNNVKKSYINKDRSLINLEIEKQSLFKKIEKSNLDLLNSAKTYYAAKNALEAQQLSFDNASARLAAGAINIYEFENIKKLWVESSINLINSKYNYIFQTKVLDYYSGDMINMYK